MGCRPLGQLQDLPLVAWFDINIGRFDGDETGFLTLEEKSNLLRSPSADWSRAHLQRRYQSVEVKRDS